MVGNGVLTGVLGVLAACVVVCVRGPCGGLQVGVCLVGDTAKMTVMFVMIMTTFSLSCLQGSWWGVMQKQVVLQSMEPRW